MFPDEVDEEIEHEQAAPVEQKSAHVPFRFPLITDEEREIFLKKEQTGEKVTMAEVREELIRRPSHQVHQTVQREIRKEQVPIQKKSARKPVKQHSQVPKTVPEDRKPEPIKRRFEPTKVPSPIHGFNVKKPTPIEELLEQKELKDEFNQAIRPSQEESTQKAIENKNDDQTTQLDSNTAKSDLNSIVSESTEEQVAALDLLSVQEKKTQTIKPETVVEQHTEQRANIENSAETRTAETLLTLQKEVESPASELLNDAATTPVNFDDGIPVHTEKHREMRSDSTFSTERKKEKTVPFNVLMLKSDKEKSKNRNFVAQNKPPEVNQQHNKEVVKVSEVQEPMITPIPNAIEAEVISSYEHPDKSFLLTPENDRKDDAWMEQQGERLIEALSHFQVSATIVSIVQGPAVTQFELTVAQGVKVSKIRNLADDLKLALAAKDIRIQAPIPGKSSIGIEIPNRTSRPVRISEVIESSQFQDSDSPLEAALGLDLTGKPVTLDLRKMPHGLIAGATGSGKSVCINSILVSLLYKSSPRDLKLLLIDPKMVELAPYNHIPHLVSPVITDVKAATASLKWAVSEMERRYQLFAHTGVRDISRYNKMVKDKGNHAQHLPYILIVIDELADLMMMSPSDVEDAICRIAQKARACGIHLVIATQRPSVDVITGLIKSNIPTRIAFSVSSQVDSRTILDSQGAERLLGKGDMLYLGNGMSAPSRIQGTFVTDEEIEKIIDHVRKQAEPDYFFKEEELIKQNTSGAEQDDLFEEACRFIMQQGSASTSLLQRKFHIGYNRAARLMDLIEEHGFISEQNGSKARSVLITEDVMSEVFQ